MCSRRLLLLVVFCLAEVALAANPRVVNRNVKDSIDLKKCVATRKRENNPYMCRVAWTASLSEGMFMKTTGRIATPKKVHYGYTLRAISLAKWEMEIMFNDPQRDFNLDFTDEGNPSIPTDASLTIRILKVRLPRGDNEKLKYEDNPNFRIAPIVEDLTSHYVLLEITPKDPSKNMMNFAKKKIRGYFVVKDSEVVSINHPMQDEGIIEIEGGKNYFNYPCQQLTGFEVVREKPNLTRYRTQEPNTPAFDHNLYDFTTMCEGEDYKPYHKDKQILSIECELGTVANTESINHVFYVDGTKEALPKGTYIPVICRTAHENCFHCGDPTTGYGFAPPAGHVAIKFIDGDKSATSHKCPRLTCEDNNGKSIGLLMFPGQINMPIREEPQCIYDEASDKYHWSITQRDRDAWNRKRVPVTGGYCWKKGGECAPLMISVTSCPMRPIPGFESCRMPALNNSLHYVCPRGLTLHQSFTRRIRMEPVVSVQCNQAEGEYEVTTLDGKNHRGFTDESWMVCKKATQRPVHEPNVAQPPHVMIRYLFGAAVGLGIYLCAMAIFFLIRWPIVKGMEFWAATEIPPEMMPSAAEKINKQAESVAAVPSSSKVAAEPSSGGGVKQPLLRQRNPYHAPSPRPAAPFTPRPSPMVAPLPPKPTSVKKDGVLSKKKNEEEEKTCLEPTKDELEILKELDRLKECTSEDDQTGKDVKAIEKEE